MTRYRWLKAEYQKRGFDLLKRELIHNAYDETTGSGFRLDFSQDDQVKGKYIVKKEIQEVILDPYENEIITNRISFDIYKFSISKSFPEITLFDPPRSAQPFFTKISVLSDFNIFISPIEIDIQAWIQSLESLSGFKCLVRKINCSGISLSSSVSGQIALAGSEDVRKYLVNMAGRNKFRMDKATLSISYMNQCFECQIGKSGTANVLSGDSNLIIGLLAGNLPIWSSPNIS